MLHLWSTTKERYQRKQCSHGDWKMKMKMVMEMSCAQHITNWPKFMEFYQSWNFINFAPELHQTCMFFATINVKSSQFPTFSAKHCKCKIGMRDGHGKLRNGHRKSHGQIFCQVCGNPGKGLNVMRG